MNWEETHGRLTAKVNNISRQCGAQWDISLTRSGLLLEGSVTIDGVTMSLGNVSAHTIGKLKHHAEMVNDLIFMSVERLEEEVKIISSRQWDAGTILVLKKAMKEQL